MGEKKVVSPLRKEIITVRFIGKKNGLDNRHVLSNGMHAGSTRTFVTPLLRNGGFVNVLTDSEKAYLEDYMQLGEGALSVHKSGNNNYWNSANPNGVGRIVLTKGDTKFDLSDPKDYIKYKVLLAHKDRIAPSLKAYQDNPKATYEYIIVSDVETSKMETLQVNIKQQAWMEFGKVNENKDILVAVIEAIEGRPLSPNVKIEYLQSKTGELIDHNPKVFVATVTDPLLPTKILIKKAVSEGILSNRGGFFYERKSNMPLCNEGQDPTLNVAAAYLNLPKNQELKFSIEAQLKALKD
jgi:hypothetical protein